VRTVAAKQTASAHSEKVGGTGAAAWPRPARIQITGRRGALRVRTEINLKGEPLMRARSANDPGRAHPRASVIVAAIIVIGRNGQGALIGICLSRAIDGAVRVANYSIVCARHMGDCEDCEGCQNGDHDMGAHYRLIADLRFFLMASLWPTSVDNPVDADSRRCRCAHPPNHIPKNQKPTATAIAAATAMAYGIQSRCMCRSSIRIGNQPEMRGRIARVNCLADFSHLFQKLFRI
jgi:hypothetical protein